MHRGLIAEILDHATEMGIIKRHACGYGTVVELQNTLAALVAKRSQEDHGKGDADEQTNHDHRRFGHGQENSRSRVNA